MACNSEPGWTVWLNLANQQGRRKALRGKYSPWTSVPNLDPAPDWTYAQLYLLVAQVKRKCNSFYCCDKTQQSRQLVEEFIWAYVPRNRISHSGVAARVENWGLTSWTLNQKQRGQSWNGPRDMPYPTKSHLPSLSHTAPSTADQLFKCLGLWGSFLIQTSTKEFGLNALVR